MWWFMVSVVIVVLQLGTSSIYAQLPAEGKTEIDLEFRVSRLAMLGHNGKVLLVSDQARRLIVFDVFTSKVMREIGYDAIASGESAPFDFHDIAVVPGKELVYLVGVDLHGSGLSVRLDLESFETRRLRFDEHFNEATLAVDAEGRIFIGNLQSSTLRVLEDGSFEGAGSRALRPADLFTSFWLSGGPAFDVEAVEPGDFVVTSHGFTSKVSLIDVVKLAIVDEVRSGRGQGSALALGTAALPGLHEPSGRGVVERQGSVLIGDYDEDLLVALDIDPYDRDRATSGPLGGSRTECDRCRRAGRYSGCVLSPRWCCSGAPKHCGSGGAR